MALLLYLVAILIVITLVLFEYLTQSLQNNWKIFGIFVENFKEFALINQNLFIFIIHELIKTTLGTIFCFLAINLLESCLFHLFLNVIFCVFEFI